MRKLLFSLGLIFSGCYYHNNIAPEVLSNGSYLPLEIGNSWDFQPLNSSTNAVVHREVMSIATIDNHKYYQLVTSSSSSTYQDTAYYRIDNNGFVFIHRKDQTNFEENRFRLNSANGDRWTYPIDNNTLATITTSVASLSLGNTEIQNCKSYHFDVINWADEEYTITLAPGIGFVKEYSNAWGFGQVLKSAKIHGEVHNF